ncbi:MAG TPA: hypothetical protein PKD26_07670 [Pyrinomonadaceae bacterium]|nr:hypothetical protein [Pyrinomonadaceae bacterium]
MFDPENMPASAGGFPWKADGDFRTLVYIKNETDTEREYTAYLTYEGGQYVSGIRKIKPHETVAIDFRTIRDEQIPDVNGVLIPLNVEHGQIAWSARGIETRVMSGRSEQISLSGGVASTYACYSCCIMRHYSSGVSQTAETINIGGSATFTAWQRDENCETVFSPYPIESPSWTSSNSTAASVDGGVATENSPGSANIQAGWWTNETIGYEVCEPSSQYVTPYVPLTVLAPTIQVTEAGFVDDHPLHKWPPPGTAIDTGYTPTWKISNNPDNPVAYTKGTNINMFAKFSITPSLVPRNVKIRVKNGSTVIANKDAEIAGTTTTIIDINTTSPLESTVKKTTPTFDWEISYNDGTTWSSIGSSGPHTMYWTYSTPLGPPFANDFGGSYGEIYDLALEKATVYGNGASDLDTIIGSINTGVEAAVSYQPALGLGNQHPMDAYSSPNQGNCSDHTHLLRGLLRSVGIDGTITYIWAGTNSSTLTYYQRGSTTNTPSFQITKGQHEGAEANPHFFYHSVIKANNNWYDPSYGEAPLSIFTLAETANNNTPRQVHETKWSTPAPSDPFFSCPHP